MTLVMFMNTYLASHKLFKKKLLPCQLVHISLQFYQMVAKLRRLVQTKNWLWSVLKEMVRLYFLCDYIATHKKSFLKENFRNSNTV